MVRSPGSLSQNTNQLLQLHSTSETELDAFWAKTKKDMVAEINRLHFHKKEAGWTDDELIHGYKWDDVFKAIDRPWRRRGVKTSTRLELLHACCEFVWVHRGARYTPYEMFGMVLSVSSDIF